MASDRRAFSHGPLCNACESPPLALGRRASLIVENIRAVTSKRLSRRRRPAGRSPTGQAPVRDPTQRCSSASTRALWLLCGPRGAARSDSEIIPST